LQRVLTAVPLFSKRTVKEEPTNIIISRNITFPKNGRTPSPPTLRNTPERRVATRATRIATFHSWSNERTYQFGAGNTSAQRSGSFENKKNQTQIHTQPSHKKRTIKLFSRSRTSRNSSFFQLTHPTARFAFCARA